jgi:CRISPR-associated protein Csm5
VFLLRVGRHSGAESVTLEGVRQIKILEGKDPQTGKQRSTTAKETKTIWLAAQDKGQQQEMSPFGWVLVEVETIERAAPMREPLEATCRERAELLARLAAELDKRRATFEQARQSAQKARQREAEEAMRKAAEQAEAARREEERQARLATMSANMRRIEEFRTASAARAEQLRGGKDRQNTEYHDRARKLARAPSEAVTGRPKKSAPLPTQLRNGCQG